MVWARRDYPAGESKEQITNTLWKSGGVFLFNLVLVGKKPDQDALCWSGFLLESGRTSDSGGWRVKLVEQRLSLG
jgi:hypothetical protein